MKLSQDDKEILRDVSASVVIPASPSSSLDTILQNLNGQEARQTLFFDEHLKVVVLLDFPPCTEEKLNTFLQNLELRVDAWALSNQGVGERSQVDGGPTRDLIASEVVPTAADPFTAVKREDDESDVRIILAWEVPLALGRPKRGGPMDQSVVFLPIAAIIDSSSQQIDADLLEPFSTSEPSVFGSFPGTYYGASASDPVFSQAGRPARFIAKGEDRLRLKHKSSDPIRAYAAVMPRLKYNKINSSLPESVTVASLDLEFIPFIDVNGTIEAITIAMANGKATSFMPDFLPMSWKSKDWVTFLYSLQPIQQSGTSTPVEPRTVSPSTPLSGQSTNLNIDVLAINIKIALNLTPTTQAQINMSWTTNVDFSQALNPAYGTPAQPLQRTNRPTSLNFAPYPDPNKSRNRSSSLRVASTSLQHQVIPQSIPRQSLTSILSVSFIAPDTLIHVGVPFIWRVLIVNNSSQAAKLAIVPLPRIQRPTNTTQHFQKRHAPKASNASATPGSYSKKHVKNNLSTAKAVVEEQILYALHHAAPAAGASAVPVETDLVSLTAETRVGPLGVGQCHETELKFVAYKSGVFNLDAIRIVDLHREPEGGVGMINDIRELPEVVVENVDAKADEVEA